MSEELKRYGLYRKLSSKLEGIHHSNVRPDLPLQIKLTYEDIASLRTLLIEQFNTRPTPHPIANAGEAMREAVARVIYPEAFTPETPHSNQVYRQMGYHEARADAFSKADAILSLLPSAPEGDAVSRVQSAWAGLLKELGHVLKEPGAKMLYREAADLDAAIRALPLPANAQAEGMALVPVEPTEAMYEAARKATWVGSAYCQRIWSAMIAASKGGE